MNSLQSSSKVLFTWASKVQRGKDVKKGEAGDAEQEEGAGHSQPAQLFALVASNGTF